MRTPTRHDGGAAAATGAADASPAGEPREGMSPDLRDRVILPLAIPLLSLLAIGVVVLSLSRILLASPKDIATSIALTASVGLLMGGSLMVVRSASVRRVAPLLLLMAGGLLGGGVYAASLGYAPLHGEEEHAAAAGPTKLRVQAVDVSFPQAALTADAGDVLFELVNAGMAPHTLVIEGVSGFKLSVDSQGATDSGSVTLEGGSYVFFCDVPGHREAGMEGSLSVR